MPGEVKLSEEKIDTFVCVHRRDVDYLLDLVLRSYQVNFLPKNKLIFITNDLPYLQKFVEKLDLGTEVIFTSDNEWLSKHELDLPGWYRQQIIKLRSPQFCSTQNFCNLGADTVLLQPLSASDLLCDGKPILYYTKHWLPDRHFLFERERVRHVAQILKVKALKAQQYVDFINDLFCFNRDYLIQLDTYLQELYGGECYYELLRNLNTSTDQNKFGEWTLYSTFVLDRLTQNISLRNTRHGFLYQAHSYRLLKLYRFNTKVVHFVAKDFNTDYIKRQIQKHNLPLGQYL